MFISALRLSSEFKPNPAFLPPSSLPKLLLAIIALAGLGSLGPLSAASAPVELQLQQATLGNVIIAEDGAVTIPLIAKDLAADVTWSLRNVWDIEVSKGVVPQKTALNSGIKIKLPDYGWFSLKVKSRTSTKTVEAETTLARLSPRPQIPANSPFGVQTHFGQEWAPDVLELYAKMGVSCLRDGIDWASVEKSKGQFHFPESYLSAIGKAQQLGMQPLQVLAFGNNLYDHTPGIPEWAAAPYTQNGFEAYARYCVATVAISRPISTYFEIWNEYNGGYARGPAAGQPKIYAEMLKTAYPAIKKNSPETVILGAATIGVPLSWIEEVFRSGGLDYMDAVSVHPYGYYQRPEVMEGKINSLRELIRKYNHGQDKPIWVTEQGYYLIKPGEAGNRSALTELTKASYLVRGWTVLLGCGVEKMFWYLGRNYSNYADMGLLGSEKDPHGRYAAKPSYAAYGVLTRLLNNAIFVRRENTAPDTFCYVFRNKSEEVRVLWSFRDQDITLESTSSAQVTDLMGNSFPLTPYNGKLHLHISSTPLYLTGTIPGSLGSSEFRIVAPRMTSSEETIPIQFTLGDIPENLTVTIQNQTSKANITDGKFTTTLLPQQNTGEKWIPFQVRSGNKIYFAGQQKIEVWPPLRLDPFPRLIDPNTLSLTVTNSSQSQPAQLTAASWTLSEKDQPKPQNKSIDLVQSIAPQTGATVKIPAWKAIPFQIYPVTVSITDSRKQRLEQTAEISYNPVPEKTVPFDKPITAWGLSDGISLDNLPYEKLEAPRKDRDDLGGTIQLAADEHYLYIAARIRDDVHFQDYTDFNTWRGDNLQIGISSDMPGTSGEWENGGHEFSLSLTPKGPQLFETTGRGGEVPDSKIRVVRLANETHYAAAIPWSAVRGAKPPLQQFAFAVFINDNDGKGRKGYARWGDIKVLSRYQLCLIR